MKNYPEERRQLLIELKKHGVAVTKEALGPLQQVDFDKLLAVHDHEENFLRSMLVQNLTALTRARPSAKAADRKVNEKDVETALKMLGVAAKGAGEQTLSTSTKRRIRAACPYC